MNPSPIPTKDLDPVPNSVDFQAIGPALRILQLNVEGLSAAKRSLLSKVCIEQKIDIICLQETHVATEEAGRFEIHGFDILSYDPHAKYGRATYVRSDISDAVSLSSTIYCDVIQVGGFQIANVYKPPNMTWGKPVLPSLVHPAVYVGDFNSHHSEWGYIDTNTDGEELVEWASNNDLALIHDVKQRGTFRSARWSRDYSPDLCWVSSLDGHQQQASCTVLDDFPHSQHRPSLIHIGLQLPVFRSSGKLRWNFRKADWNKYSDTLERSVVTIPTRNIPVEEAYNRFGGAIRKAASVAIPRGHRPVYTPCLDAECAALLKQYEASGDPDIADHLIESLNAARCARWEKETANMDFTHSSRKSWNLLRRLGAAQQPPAPSRPLVKPNQVASHLLHVARAPMDKHVRRQARDEWRQYHRRIQTQHRAEPFTTEELDRALQSAKPGTAAGYDNISPEFLQHLGPQARKWLAQFATRTITENRLPRAWRIAKIIALPKPGKDLNLAASYRPISLLSVCFKVLERLILQRISADVENILQVEQAGFRKGRSTCDQVLALTTFIENGFQKTLKTGAVFLDLTAAYDTVWHTGLLVKISRVLPRWAVDAIELLLRDRRFRVHMGDSASTWKRQVNGLPQGSVLSPTLFNLYTNDLPSTTSRKFIYADDICCGAQARTFSELEKILNSDMSKIDEYCRKWRLQPSVTKTVSSVFHLHNAGASKELNIVLNGQRLKHDPHPVYLGVTMDRTLTFHNHLKKTAAKVTSRNNLLSKLAGSNWGAKTRTLRLSALALCYSSAEYCAPVWCRSSHTKLVDVQLNASMRTISGTLRPTPLPWLPVLSNIAPPHIRREVATAKLVEKIRENPRLPLHQDLFHPPRTRLRSRRPVWASMHHQKLSAAEAWQLEWSHSDVTNQFLVADVTVGVPGSDLPRRLWSLLNRFRTGQGLCAANLYTWGLRDDPCCQCGERQTMTHIVDECPLTRLQGGLRTLHTADKAAVVWLGKTSKR